MDLITELFTDLFNSGILADKDLRNTVIQAFLVYGSVLLFCWFVVEKPWQSVQKRRRLLAVLRSQGRWMSSDELETFVICSYDAKVPLLLAPYLMRGLIEMNKDGEFRAVTAVKGGAQ